MGRLPSSPTMILLSEEKSSNALPPGSSLVTEQNAPSHTEDKVSSSGSIQQHAQSSAPPQGDYDPEELPPPTYESIKNAGNSIRRIVIQESRRAHAKFSDEHVPNVDVKSEATTTRDDYA